MSIVQPGPEFDADQRKVTIAALREYINELQYRCEVFNSGWEDDWVRLQHARRALSALEEQADET